MKPTANSNIGPGTAATLALTTSSADVSAATVSQGKLLGISWTFPSTKVKSFPYKVLQRDQLFRF